MPGEPVATIDATAATLLLVLWGRLPAQDPAVTWTGTAESPGLARRSAGALNHPALSRAGPAVPRPGQYR